jgi:hypothetical protein
MDSMESQMMTLIHKVDTLYERIEHLNRKMAIVLSKGGYTKNHNPRLPQLDLRISDYYPKGEILDSGWERQHTDTNGQILHPTLSEEEISTPKAISEQYLEEEDCYPSGETKERSLIHQDILGNQDYLEDMVECDPPNITDDIQIRRLTAQLTAAYNRIAALEEQLLAKRTYRTHAAEINDIG